MVYLILFTFGSVWGIGDGGSNDAISGWIQPCFNLQLGQSMSCFYHGGGRLHRGS